MPRYFVGANFFLILFASCNEAGFLGTEVQPGNTLLNISASDTITLLTKTIKSDSIRTDETIALGVSTDVLLGTYIDPVFGKTSASLYSQLKLSSNNPNFGTTPVIDSVVLSLVYSTPHYGKKQYLPQVVNVHAINQALAIGNNYYSNDSISVLPTDIANGFIMNPRPSQSVIVKGQVLSPQLRIPLDNSFGQQLLNLQGTSSMGDNAGFQSYLKGIYVTTQNSLALNNAEGNLFRFNMDNAQTKLTLYYHNNTDDSLEYSFAFDGLARFSNFKHANNLPDVDLSAQLSGSSSAQNNTVFIQPMAGTKVKIEMPYLMNLLDSGKVGINQAELTVKANTSPGYQTDTFSVPSKLALYGINDDGSIFLLADAFEGDNYFGGIYNAASGQYTFNIARYIQQVLDGKLKNNGLYLQAVYEVINPSRLVIGGGGKVSNSYQMKLSITQTKLP